MNELTWTLDQREIATLREQNRLLLDALQKDAAYKMSSVVISANTVLIEALREARKTINMLYDEAPNRTWIDTTLDITQMTIEQIDNALKCVGEKP